MANIREGAEEFLADKLIKKLIKTAKKDDPTKDYLAAVDLIEKAAGNIYKEHLFKDLRRMVSDKDNRWVRMLHRAATELDEHVLRTLALNIGYNASIKGIRRKNELVKKYNCNIPNIILFDPTTACNMHCIGCWSAEYGNKWNLSYEEMEKILREGEELGCHLYFLTGGEPLVRKDDLVRLATEFPQSAFHVFTNGTLIDDAFCEKMRELGNIVLAISLEGFEEENDARRGDGCYQKAIAGMKCLHEHGLPFVTSICYTSQNLDTVTSDAFLQFLIDLGCYHVWYFHYMPVGVNAVPELMPTAEQREFMIKRVRYLRSEDCDLEIFVGDFQNDGQFVGGCIAGGRNYMHINAKGDFEPCVFIHYSDANIRDVSILEAMQMPLFKAYHEGQPFNHNHLRPCPMLENPEILAGLVEKADAKSTDYIAEESPSDLYTKTKPYADQWTDTANKMWEEFGSDAAKLSPERRAELVREQEEHQARLNETLSNKFRV